MTNGSAPDALAFDPHELKAKYIAERDKRVKAAGNEQYVEMAGGFAHYLDDPYVQPGFQRAPLTDDVEVAVIGGGFGGLLSGARLREAGVESVRVIEKGGDFGGTWYWNRYPGAACDVESYIYLPLLEEIGFMPRQKYTPAPEILAHCRAIGQHYDLYRDACFQTEVTGLDWDEAAARWIIRTNRGDAMRARFVIMANGPLHRPKLPGIPGVESFTGHSFHTSRWDYDYTGGDPEGNLHKLADKRVGVIGTGATAVQCVPHLGASAKQLYVFQRTPSSIDVRNNRPTDPEWVKTLTPGWQKRRMDNFNVLVTGGFQQEDLVNDGWTEIIRNILLLTPRDGAERSPEELVQLADFKKMEQIRARVESVVADPQTAEALKPWYNQFCKRPCFHDDYLPTFNRPNVTLVDTDGKGVERIAGNAVIANGQAYEIDCLIYATGFEVGTEYTRRSGYDLVGRDGLTLSEKWKDGVSTLHGIQTRGFPNIFIIQPSQSGFAVNFPHMLDEQTRHIAYVVDAAMKSQARTIEPSEAAEAEWVETIKNLAVFRQKFLEECTPGYYNNEGKPNPLTIRNGAYGKGPVAYADALRSWRDAGDLAGLEIKRA